MNEQSVEEWARTARFEKPVRLGEVEAGILSRRPVSPRAGWWLPLVSVVGWASMGLAWLLGAGAPLLGLLLVWLGTRTSDDDAGWLSLARMVFVVSALGFATMMFELRRERRERATVMGLLGVSATLACVWAYVRLESAAPSDVPWGLVPAIVGAGFFTAALSMWFLVAKPPPRRDKAKEPPLRGPKSDIEQGRYIQTRERVLDILTHRGLVKFDEGDRIRLRDMPLGYWEELDDVDERERRRILEYRIFGWRTFTEADARPWPPRDERAR